MALRRRHLGALPDGCAKRGGSSARVTAGEVRGRRDGGAGQGGDARGRGNADVAGRGRRAPSWRLPDIAGEFFDRASHWARAEVGPGRLVPWLPVAFGAGIVVYFTAPREPLLWAPLLLFAALAAIAVALRARPVGFPVMLGFAAAAAGLAAATTKTQWIDHPVLQHPVPSAAVTGWVEVRESRERKRLIAVAALACHTPVGQRAGGLYLSLPLK